MSDENNTLSVLPKSSGASASTSPGAGMAFESVSQSASMAVQDAAGFLRHIEAVSAAAIAVLTEKYVATKEEKYMTMISKVTDNLDQAATEFGKISEQAANVLKSFSPGAGGGG